MAGNYARAIGEIICEKFYASRGKIRGIFLVFLLSALGVGIFGVGSSARGDSLVSDVVYKLPYQRDESLLVTQAYQTNFTHKPGGSDAYALDFAKNGCEIYGKPIVVVAPGKVVAVNGLVTKTGYGIMAKIQHSNGAVSLYAHMSKLLVSAGQEIKAFQTIGYMGNTGFVAGTACKKYPGAHLHFALRETVAGKIKAVLPEPISKYTNIKSSKWYISDNGPEPEKPTTTPQVLGDKIYPTPSSGSGGGTGVAGGQTSTPPVTPIIATGGGGGSTPTPPSSPPVVAPVVDLIFNASSTVKRVARLEFTVTPAGAQAWCQLNGAPVEQCTSPRVYTDLAGGPQDFKIYATFNNQTSTVIGCSWWVDMPQVTVELFDRDSQSREFANDLTVGVAANATGTVSQWFLAPVGALSGGAENGFKMADGSEITGWQESAPTILNLTSTEGLQKFNLLTKDSTGYIDSWPAEISLDQTPPNSRVEALPELLAEELFTLTWLGNDNLSGVDYYQVQYQIKNSGAWNFWSWSGKKTEKIYENSLSFKGQSRKTYEFRARAVDKAGNWETWPDWPDTFTLIEARGAQYLDVIINEVAWMGTNATTSDEWLELYNNTPHPIDMSGWKLSGGSWEVDLGVLSNYINGYSYLVLAKSGAVTKTLGASKTLPAEVDLNDAGEKLTISDNHARLIDSVDCAGGWFAGNNSTSTSPQSMERINSKGEGSDSSNWGEHLPAVSSRGYDANGGALGGTASMPNSVSYPEEIPVTILQATWSSSTITGDYTFTKEGSPYLLLGGSMSISGDVVIEPGAIIRFGPPSMSNFYWLPNLSIGGKLTAIGTAEEPIIITSNYDLEYPGARPINPGYDDRQGTMRWGKLNAGGEVVMENVIMRWGDGLRLTGGTPRVSNCRFEGLSGSYVQNASGQLAGMIALTNVAGGVLDNNVLIGNSFSSYGLTVLRSTAGLTKNQFNYLGTVVRFGEYLGGTPDHLEMNMNTIAHNKLFCLKTAAADLVLNQNVYSDNTNNYVSIQPNDNEWDGDAEMVSNQTWSGETAYVINEYTFNKATSTLTIEPGTVIYLHPVSSPYPEGCNLETTGLGLAGPLVARGTAEKPIVFTNFDDSEYPEGPGLSGDYSHCSTYWSSISLSNTSTEQALEWVTFRHGGASMVTTPNSALSISHVDNLSMKNLEFNSNRGTLKISVAQNVSVLGSTFKKNIVAAEISSSSGLFTNNQFIDNPESVNFKKSGAWEIRDNFSNIQSGINYTAINDHGDSVPARITAPTVWGTNTNMPYIIAGRLEVENGLKIEPGVTVKLSKFIYDGGMNVVQPSGRLHWRGTAEAPITLTSIKDDSADGDTNGDGLASVPAAGDWGGIYLNQTTDHILEYVNFNYGGKGDYSSVLTMNQAQAVINRCAFTNSSGAGLRWKSVAPGNLTLTASRFENNAVGLVIDSASVGPWENITGQIFAGNTQWGVLNNSVTFLDAGRNWWGSADGPRWSGNTTSTGDKISERVNFDPWLTERP